MCEGQICWSGTFSSTDLEHTIDTFFLFFSVRLQFRRADNLFYVKETLIKISPVRWKHFLVFTGSSI